MRAPQIILIVLYVMSLTLSLYKHGEPQTGTYNFWISLFSYALVGGLLWWGGFFG